MVRLLRRITPALVIGALLGLISVASACPFCFYQGTTLTTEVDQAQMVLYGTLANANANPNGVDLSDGTTELHIEAVVKKPGDAKLLGDGKMIVLPRHIPPQGKANEYKYLVFLDVYKGKLDPYRGVAVKADSHMAKYIAGALAVKDAKADKRLRFFFDYLDDADLEIANDALKEFANADYRDYQGMAKDLPAEKIAGWLKDEKTPEFRYGLYASLLGHCGKVEHADQLRDMLANPKKRVNSGVDGILAAYTMLKPKEGLALIRSILGDEKKDFMLRFAALRSLRFFHTYRDDLVSKKECGEAAALLLTQKDMADMAVEDLRKWGLWDMTGRVLEMRGTKAFEVPIVRRTVLRFMLASPEPAAKKYVEEQRMADPEYVKDVEELLKIETEPPPAKRPPVGGGAEK